MEPEGKEILALGMAGYLGQPRSVPTLAGIYVNIIACGLNGKNV